MIDIRRIEENPAKVQELLKNKGYYHKLYQLQFENK